MIPSVLVTVRLHQLKILDAGKWVASASDGLRPLAEVKRATREDALREARVKAEAQVGGAVFRVIECGAKPVHKVDHGRPFTACFLSRQLVERSTWDPDLVTCFVCDSRRAKLAASRVAS